jgi:hypothetical protein
MNKLSETFQNLGLTNEQTEKMSNIFKHRLELKKGEYFYQNTQICDKIGFLEKGILRSRFKIGLGQKTSENS